MQIQKLRLKRGWSQLQLAEASGLSVRTVQRIEAGYPASTESLKSLAAVFEVDFATLCPDGTMNGKPRTPAEQAEAEAFEHVRKLSGFYVHALQFVLLNLGLLAFNLIFMPQFIFVYWVAIAWGVALLVDALRVFGLTRLFGPEWEKRQVEKRLGRPL